MHCMTTLIGITTTVIAGIVAWIAYQQHILAGEKFKLDLFEKRFAIYKATETFINEIVGAKSSSVEGFSELHKRFGLETQTVSFLFDKVMADFIDDLAKKGNMVTIAKGLNNELRVGANTNIWQVQEIKF